MAYELQDLEYLKQVHPALRATGREAKTLHNILASLHRHNTSLCTLHIQYTLNLPLVHDLTEGVLLVNRYGTVSFMACQHRRTVRKLTRRLLLRPSSGEVAMCAGSRRW